MNIPVRPGARAGSRQEDHERMRTSTGLLIVVMGGALCILLISGCGEGRVEQPIEYSHKAHVQSAGIVCVDCHQSVETGIRASIPPLETCKGCHSDNLLTESPEEKKLLHYLADGAEVPWNKVYHVPDHVYFSHRRHVSGGKVVCQECHGDVASFVNAVSFQFLPVTMENCMKCHKERNVTNDCLACHR